MASTPPPPRRVHTPPTPLHGPKYDNYEPYSPRRSSRVASQNNKTTPSPRFASSPLTRTVTTPPASIRNPRTRSSGHFSPPSSPDGKRVSIVSPRKRLAKAKSPFPASDSDTDILPEKHHQPRHISSSKDSFGMLSTPAKTPRSKRKDFNDASAARLLFGDNEGLLEPTPSRKRRTHNMDEFGILEDEDLRPNGRGSGIQIFTDMKERVPSVGADDDNPFLSKNAASSSKASTSKSRSTRRKSARDVEMDEATREERGMVYVFRGKKIFRKYDSAIDNPSRHSPATGTEGEDDDTKDDNLSDDSIRRKAGPAAASHRLTRSTIKPRLLFPTDEQRREREERANLADSEAVDIQMPVPATPHGKGRRQITPPTTVKTRKVTPTEQLAPELQDAVQEPKVETKRKRGIFDGFQRKKVASGGAGALAGQQGIKRQGSPMDGERGSQAKRTRSSAAASFPL